MSCSVMSPGSVYGSWMAGSSEHGDNMENTVLIVAPLTNCFWWGQRHGDGLVKLPIYPVCSLLLIVKSFSPPNNSKQESIDGFLCNVITEMFELGGKKQRPSLRF